MIFRQLFNPADSAMTYLIGDPASGEAVVIDPLKYQATLIRALLAEHHLRLKYVLRTHVHAPNRVDCGNLCPHTGAQFVIGRHNDSSLAGERVADGDVLRFGDESIAVIETPATHRDASLITGATGSSAATCSNSVVAGRPLMRPTPARCTTAYASASTACPARR